MFLLTRFSFALLCNDSYFISYRHFVFLHVTLFYVWFHILLGNNSNDDDNDNDNNNVYHGL
jgi:hypothetical protein